MLWQWYTGVFTKIETVTPTTRRFWVEIPELINVDFKAGQFMTFDLPIHEKRNRRWRSYSIASAPDGTNVLEFVIVLLEEGAGTSYLFNEVKEGDSLKLRGPLGKFVLPEVLNLDKEICFVCTGTGIAPFRAMLHTIKNNNIPHPKMHLVFGTRTENYILYRQEMIEMQKEWPNFTYHICLSRETIEGCERGYVHKVYEKLYADKRPTVFYLCGWNVMLDEARERLKNMGYEKKDVRFESYG